MDFTIPIKSRFWQYIKFYFKDIELYLKGESFHFLLPFHHYVCSTGELGYDGLNATRKIGPSYAKSVVYI